MTLYKTVQNGDERSVTMMFETLEDVSTEVITESNPHFDKVLQLLESEQNGEISTSDAENEISRLVNPFIHITAEINAINENITYSDNKVFHKHEPLDDIMARVILGVVGESSSANDSSTRNKAQSRLKALSNFIDKLYSGATETGRRNLFRWIQDREITIFPDGDFLAYKGVVKQEDGSFVSQFSGTSYVDNVLYENSQIPNYPGAVVSMPPSAVEEDEDTHCGAPGLHAGTYAYALGWHRGGLLNVKINPADVVSVPKDAEGQKIRTSRYTVIDLTEKECESSVFFNEDDDEYYDEWEDEEEFSGYDEEDYDEDEDHFGDRDSDNELFNQDEESFEENLDDLDAKEEKISEAYENSSAGALLEFEYNDRHRVLVVEDVDFNRYNQVDGTVVNEGDAFKAFKIANMNEVRVTYPESASERAESDEDFARSYNAHPSHGVKAETTSSDSASDEESPKVEGKENLSDNFKKFDDKLNSWFSSLRGSEYGKQVNDALTKGKAYASKLEDSLDDISDRIGEKFNSVLDDFESTGKDSSDDKDGSNN